MERIPPKYVSFQHASTARLLSVDPLGFTLLLALLSLSLVSHARGQEPAEWKIKGAEAALQDAHPAVRIEALKKLGALKASRAIPRIAEQLNDGSCAVQAAAILALGSMGSAAQSYARQISSHLRDPEKDVQLAAIRAMGVMGGEARGYAQQIADLLNEGDNDIRLAAVTALGAMEEAARDHLSEVDRLRKNPPSLDVSAAAAVAGCRIGETSNNRAPAIAALLQGHPLATQLAAIKALGEMGERARAQSPQIIALVNNPNAGDSLYMLRAEAIVTLGKAAPSRQNAQIVKGFLQSSEESFRAAALRSLAAMGAAAADTERDVINQLGNTYPPTRAEAVRTLVRLREGARQHLPYINSLKETGQQPYLRDAAGLAICGIQPEAGSCAPAVINLLKDSNDPISEVAAEVLELMGPLDLGNVCNVIAPVYDDALRIGELRFLAHLLGGGNNEVELLLKWLGRSGENLPGTLDRKESLRVLSLARGVTPFPVRDDLERRINELSGSEKMKLRDLIFKKWGPRLGLGLLAHVLFWIILIGFYPNSLQIQALIFWNSWVRRITGLGYVGFALTWVPYLRTKLFEPFKESLLSEAYLEGFESENYYPQSEVQKRVGKKLSGLLQPVSQAIPEIKGQIVLEGESGLGKTMFLRYLLCQSLQRSPRVVVYLPASKCAGGVIEAIQKKLHGPARDPDFLRNLIYSGALDICLDGLNEVSADTRARVTEFTEAFFQGNIIIATQRMESWTPPALATVYTLQPLRLEEIKNFLYSRNESPDSEATVTGDDYEQACRDYLAEALSDRQPKEQLEAARIILSNPMDLTLVAEMLARGEKPDVFRLIEQQYEIMSDDYKLVNVSANFPLHRFAEEVYQMHLHEKFDLPEEEFLRELQCMERYKMVLTRQRQGQKTVGKDWYFRHDKIKEFFLAQAFQGKDDSRKVEHLRDPRFRGVYLMLATLLPLAEARELSELLLSDAVNTGDHTLSDSAIRILDSRERTLSPTVKSNL